MARSKTSDGGYAVDRVEAVEDQQQDRREKDQARDALLRGAH